MATWTHLSFGIDCIFNCPRRSGLIEKKCSLYAHIIIYLRARLAYGMLIPRLGSSCGYYLGTVTNVGLSNILCFSLQLGLIWICNLQAKVYLKLV
jgi:hypothetical protein